jgi:4-hydroxy-3-methylbut-2-enyl diphosphate reductase IspH
MQILRSKVLGYCNGVSRVIELAQECVDRAHNEGVNAYSIGWFIHNPHVVARFAAQGMIHIDSPVGIEPGIALVRAHGITDILRNAFL